MPETDLGENARFDYLSVPVSISRDVLDERSPVRLSRTCQFWCCVGFACFHAIGIAGCSWLPFGDAHRNQVSQELNEQARVSEEKGNLRQATESLTRAASVDRSDVASRVNLARLHREAGRTDQAIATLREIVELTPDDARTWYELGELEYSRGNNLAANECLELALRYNPRMIPALMLKGELEEKRLFDKQALEFYHRVLALDPGQVRAMFKIARIQLRQDEPIRAALLLRTICQCRGASEAEIAEARWLLGLAYGQQLRWEDATNSLQIALELFDQPLPGELYYLAYAQYRSGQRYDAAQTGRRILQDAPDHAPARQLLAAATEDDASIQRVAYPGNSPPAARVPIAPPGWEAAGAPR